MPYRPAIDGLRAIAVLLVLLYHAKLPFFSGGYVGVDVFFVISGYLITSLIYHEHVAGRLTLIGFYERRIRRIFPALFLVLLSTLAVAAMVVLPRDVARLGSSAVATTLFLSNFYFWKQGQLYLQGNPDEEPLIHTWSLAIEEQFYLLFPICLLVAIRIFKRWDIVVAGAALSSFAICVYLTFTRPPVAFFFSSSRAWELLLGACIAITNVRDFVPRWSVPALQSAGAAMIAVAAIGYDARTAFPGFAALLPCLGAALIIAWCDRESLVNRLLSQPACVGLGLISYPLYLWHWPLLALTRLAFFREPTPLEIAGLYGLAGLLAAATWVYIEKPIRARRGWFTTGRVFVLAAGVSCLAVAAGATLRIAERLWLPPPDAARMLAAANDYAPGKGRCHNWDYTTEAQFADCTIGVTGRSEFDFALWGDSHGGAIADAVAAAAQSATNKGLQFTSDNCPPLLRTEIIINNVVTDCEARNAAVFELLRLHHIHRVILAGAWVQYVDGKTVRSRDEPGRNVDRVTSLQHALRSTAERLRSSGIDVVIVAPVPDIGWNVPSALAMAAWLKRAPPKSPSRADFFSSQRHILPLLEDMQRQGAHVVYPHEWLCTSVCRVQIGDEVLYSDSEHLSTRGADLLRPAFTRELSRATVQR